MGGQAEKAEKAETRDVRHSPLSDIRTEHEQTTRVRPKTTEDDAKGEGRRKGGNTERLEERGYDRG